MSEEKRGHSHSVDHVIFRDVEMTREPTRIFFSHRSGMKTFQKSVEPKNQKVRGLYQSQTIIGIAEVEKHGKRDVKEREDTL